MKSDLNPVKHSPGYPLFTAAAVTWLPEAPSGLPEFTHRHRLSPGPGHPVTQWTLSGPKSTSNNELFVPNPVVGLGELVSAPSTAANKKL